MSNISVTSCKQIRRILFKATVFGIVLTCCQSAFPPSWSTKDYRAAYTGHHCLGMAEDGGDPVTP